MVCVVCKKEDKSIKTITCSTECKKQHLINKKNKKQLEKYGHEKYNSLIECKICGLRSIYLGCHFRMYHGISTEEYKKQYNVKITCNKEFSKMLSDKSLGDKNPIHKLKDKRIISPYSYMFYMRKGYDEKTSKRMALEKSKKTHKNMNNDQRPVHLDYWIKKCNGDVKSAKILYKERQTTFSQKKCIEKYGKQKGLEIWKKRQNKWQTTLKSKPEQEIKNIEYKKGNSCRVDFLINKYGKQKALSIIKSRLSSKSYSNISQRLFKSIFKRLKNTHDIYFATKHNDGIYDNNKNDEFIVHTNKNFRFLDFYIPSIKKCIEFDGDYYHSEKFRKGNKKRDADREQEIKETIDGIQILHIKENEYRA